MAVTRGWGAVTSEAIKFSELAKLTSQRSGRAGTGLDSLTRSKGLNWPSTSADVLFMQRGELKYRFHWWHVHHLGPFLAWYVLPLVLLTGVVAAMAFAI